MISSVYNPIGLGAPFILTGRRIIQQLCQEKLQCDEKMKGQHIRSLSGKTVC